MKNYMEDFLLYSAAIHEAGHAVINIVNMFIGKLESLKIVRLYTPVDNEKEFINYEGYVCFPEYKVRKIKYNTPAKLYVFNRYDIIGRMAGVCAEYLLTQNRNLDNLWKDAKNDSGRVEQLLNECNSDIKCQKILKLKFWNSTCDLIIKNEKKIHLTAEFIIDYYDKYDPSYSSDKVMGKFIYNILNTK